MILERRKVNRMKAIGAIFLLLTIIGLGFGASFYSILSLARPMVRNIENKIVLYKTRNFNEVQTDTFLIRYEDMDQDLLDLVIKTAEDKYTEVTQAFGPKLEEQILIVIYNDTDLMMNTTMLSKGDPPMGVYYGNSIHVANPKTWVSKAEDMEYKFYYEGPILHELVHLYTDHVARGNFPMWFTEGVSLYFEYMIDDYEWGQEVDFAEDDYTIKELSRNFKGLNQYRAYTKSFRLVKSLVDRQGLEGLMKIMTSLGKGHSFNEFIYLFQ